MQSLKILPFPFCFFRSVSKREQYIGLITGELKPNLGGKGFERQYGSLFNFIVSILSGKWAQKCLKSPNLSKIGF